MNLRLHYESSVKCPYVHQFNWSPVSNALLINVTTVLGTTKEISVTDMETIFSNQGTDIKDVVVLGHFVYLNK